VAQQEIPKKEMPTVPEMPFVPRPAVFGWGVGFLCVGLLLAFIGAADEYGGAQLLVFGASVAGLGAPMLMLGLLIHAIRVEGAATRLGIVSPYQEKQEEVQSIRVKF
jgi:hypothetical protein